MREPDGASNFCHEEAAEVVERRAVETDRAIVAQAEATA